MTQLLVIYDTPCPNNNVQNEVDANYVGFFNVIMSRMTQLLIFDFT